MVECKQNLHEVVPNGVLRYRPIIPLCLLDDTREVAATAVLHEDVQCPCVAVNVAVVVSDDVVMV